jgi:hypothetical protein
MGCKKDWSPDFLRGVMTKSFMFKTYRDHQKDVLTAQAETALGALQDEAKRQNQIEELSVKIRNLQRELIFADHVRKGMDLELEYNLGYKGKNRKSASEYVKALCREPGLSRSEISALICARCDKDDRVVDVVDRLLDHMNFISTKTMAYDLATRRRRLLIICRPPSEDIPADDATRKDFFMACPRPECNGRLSTRYKCGLCDHTFCSKCHAENSEGHECKKDDLDTVALIHQNTRPCPGCHQGIFKTEGCDQMWCVSCHTTFSWSTGRVVTGVIHNPHYYEFRRRAGTEPLRNLGDIPCGGMPSVEEVAQFLNRTHAPEMQDHTHRLFDHHRMCNEVIQVVMPRVHYLFHNRDAATRDIGILFLRNLITREAWRDGIYRAFLQEEKYRRYYQILETLTHTMTEIFRQLVVRHLTIPDAARQCDNLAAYINEQFGVLRKQYNMKISDYSIDDEEEED